MLKAASYQNCVADDEEEEEEQDAGTVRSLI